MKQFIDIVHNRQFQNIALSQLFTVFSTNLLLPVLPVYLKLRGFSDGQIGIIMGITAIGALTVRPWAGLRVDERGSRPVILFGQALTALGLAGFLWANSFFSFLGLRLMQGVAMAFYGTGAITFASSVERPENTAGAISLYSVATMVGLGVATGSAPLLYDQLGFKPLIILGLAAVGTAAAVMRLRACFIPPCPAGERVPFSSVARSREVLAPTVCLFASNFAHGTAFTFVPLVALSEGITGYSVFFIAFTVAVVSARLGVQPLTARWGAERAALFASLLNALSVLLLAFKASAAVLALSGILIGFGFGIIFPCLAVYVVQHSNPANKGTALSILSASGDIGVAVGASVLGVVAEWLGYKALFAAAAMVVLVCTYYFYISLFGGRQEALFSSREKDCHNV